MVVTRREKAAVKRRWPEVMSELRCCAEWKSFWGGKGHSHQRHGAEDQVLRGRQSSETTRHWVSVAGAAWARGQQTKGVWGGAWDSEAMLERKKASSAIVREALTMCMFLIIVRNASQLLHDRFPSQVLEPSSSKTGFSFTTVQNLLTYLGFKSFAHTLEHCF